VPGPYVRLLAVGYRVCLFLSTSCVSTFVYGAVVGKYEGSIAESNVRNVGKQAHNMPMLSSIAENIAALGTSKVGSGEFAMRTSVWRRMMDEIHTLRCISLYRSKDWMNLPATKSEDSNENSL